MKLFIKKINNNHGFIVTFSKEVNGVRYDLVTIREDDPKLPLLMHEMIVNQVSNGARIVISESLKYIIINLINNNQNFKEFLKERNIKI